MTMLFWRNTVFNNCLILQCPTENVRKRLERWHFKSALRVISNGMIPVEKREESGSDVLGVSGGSDSIEQDVFTVISTGRYSVEKDQITLLRAMKYSRHAARIRLILAGRGPEEKKLKRFAQMLLRKNYITRPVEFPFCSRKELSEIYRQCNLYVHCAVVEVEGLGCTEAISEGLVPVIAEARLSGTSQFALSDKNLFRARDARDLARTIDYWFEHRDELEKQSAECRTIGEKYSFDKTVRAIMQMYEDALSTRKESI